MNFYSSLQFVFLWAFNYIITPSKSVEEPKYKIEYFVPKASKQKKKKKKLKK